MHARIDPAIEETRLRMRTRIDLEVGKHILSAHPTLSYWIAKEQAAWAEAGLQFNLRAIA